MNKCTFIKTNYNDFRLILMRQSEELSWFMLCIFVLLSYEEKDWSGQPEEFPRGALFTAWVHWVQLLAICQIALVHLQYSEKCRGLDLVICTHKIF